MHVLQQFYGRVLAHFTSPNNFYAHQQKTKSEKCSKQLICIAKQLCLDLNSRKLIPDEHKVEAKREKCSLSRRSSSQMQLQLQGGQCMTGDRHTKLQLNE